MIAMTVGELRLKLSMLPADLPIVLHGDLLGFKPASRFTMVDLVATRSPERVAHGVGKLLSVADRPGTRAIRTRGVLIA